MKPASEAELIQRIITLKTALREIERYILRTKPVNRRILKLIKIALDGKEIKDE